MREKGVMWVVFGIGEVECAISEGAVCLVMVECDW